MAWITGQRYLSYEEAKQNAQLVVNECIKWGMTKEAICGLLGNMWRESHVNPSLDEMSGGGGYGLTQWTPKSKLLARLTYLNLSDTGDNQLKVLQKELTEGANNGGSPFEQWYDVSGYTIQGFMKATNIDEAVKAFLACYERAGVSALAERLEYAHKFANDLDFSGSSSGGEGTGLQLAVFPVHENCTITQGENGGYSHMGTYAMDITTGYQVVFPYYAPFDMEVVEIISAYTQIAWQSKEKVKWVDGTEDYVSLWTIHDENFSRWKVGDSVTKNQEIGHSGQGGSADGIHFHLESARGQYQGGFFNSQRVFEIRNKAHNYDIYSICNNNPKGEPIIITGGNYPWKCNNTYQDGSGGGSTPTPDKRKNRYIKNVMLGITPA